MRVFVVEKGELPVHRLFKKCFMMDLCPWEIFFLSFSACGLKLLGRVARENTDAQLNENFR